MHDILYENQRALDDDSLVDYANSIGLDVRLFVHDMRTHKYAQRVRDDFRSVINSGVNGTPTFFVNGLRYDQPWDLRSLTQALLSAADARKR
jgi:predicted DsbA family dithiol-disulfide isomerase